VPIRKDGEIIAVLDIDSADYNTFDAIDQRYLEQIRL
jgi:putative methionine-R-sulfoxide reductase with GAF domain